MSGYLGGGGGHADIYRQELLIQVEKDFYKITFEGLFLYLYITLYYWEIYIIIRN